MILATHGIVASQIVTVPVATAATGIGETSFTANWNAYTGADYYLLDVSEFSDFSTFVYEDQIVLAPNTSYVVIGLNPNTTYYYRLRANVGYDPEAQAFFDRVTTAGGSLSTAEQDAVNDLVIQMKADGIWTKMKAIYPMVGASAAACAQNLVSSSFTGSFSSGWTFASTGAKGNGTSAYMDTNFNPNTSSNANSKHMSYYSRDNFDNCQIGISASGFDQIFYVGGAYYNILSTSGFSAITTATTKGLVIASRISAIGGCTTYVNNSNLGNDGLTASGNPNGNLWLNARNPSTSGTATSNECAFASIGDGLTDTDASNFYTAVQTFNQALSRQVGPQIVSDSDAQAFVNRVYTAGGTLTDTEAEAVNQLVIDMKADGIWTKMQAVYPMVGASAAACSQNLKSSSFTGTFTSGWTFASTGVTPNGTSAYMDTGLNASTQLSTPSHLSKYTGTNDKTGSDEIDMGIADFWLSLWYQGAGYDNLLARNQSSGVLLNGGTVTDSRGFGLTTKISNTAKIFMNNVQKDSQTDTTTTYTNNNVYLGSWNNSGAGLYSKRDFRFASIGDGLTDTEASDFYDAVQAFNTTLARQV